MSLKFVVLCAILAIARAGYLEPALRYAHAAPLAFPAPAPLTYTFPPTVKAEHLPPVVTTSYGYSSAHTPVPAPIIRAEPIHVAPEFHAAPAPLAFATPAIHSASLARVALPAPAPVSFAAPAPLTFAAPAPLSFATPAIHSASLARVALPAPAPVSFAAPAPLTFAAPAPLSFAAPGLHAASIARVALPAPAPVTFAGPAIHAAPLSFAGPVIHGAPLAAQTLRFGSHLDGSHLAFGRNYAAGFGFGAAPGIPTGLSFGGHLGRSFVAPAPLNFGHSSYGNHF